MGKKKKTLLFYLNYCQFGFLLSAAGLNPYRSDTTFHWETMFSGFLPSLGRTQIHLHELQPLMGPYVLCDHFEPHFIT